MASKQDEIVSEIASETVKQVTKEIPGLVKAEFEKLKDTNSPSNNNEEDDEEDDDEEKEKSLTDLINTTVKNAVNENMGNLFKDLNSKREPEFHVDDVKEKVYTRDVFRRD